MKTILTLCSLVLIFISPMVHGQGLNIAVIDMQSALKGFYKTQQEIDRINGLGREKIANIDDRKAAYEQMTSDMMKLDKVVRDTSLSESRRQDARAKLEELAKTRLAKANEINDAERKAQNELLQARQIMEANLFAEIRKMIDSVSQAKGFDLVFDKSHLPKVSSKSIVFTSTRVTDITNEVIARLNAQSPRGN